MAKVTRLYLSGKLFLMFFLLFFNWLVFIGLELLFWTFVTKILKICEIKKGFWNKRYWVKVDGLSLLEHGFEKFEKSKKGFSTLRP